MNPLSPRRMQLSNFQRAATGVLLLALSFVLTGLPPRAAQNAGDWEKALAPLQTMPVQDFGFVRSGTTFGINHLEEIAGLKEWDGMSALHTVLWLIADPAARRETPLLKLSHPDLVKMFEAKRISLSRFRDPAIQLRLNDLYHTNTERWQRPLGELETRAQKLESLPNDFAIVPRTGDWLTPAAVSQPTALDQPILVAWQALQTSLAANDVAAGAQAASALAEAVRSAALATGKPLPRLGLDVFYQTHAPFAKSALFYVLAALGFGGALLFGPRWMGIAGYVLLTLGFIEGAVGIGSRWILAGQAPLSNMFESFTFAVTGMVLLTLIFEAIWRNWLAGLGGSVLGFIFMVLAHKAPIFYSQIRPLMPALQSSWLTYHVVTIMLSYSAFALSFFISLCYLGKDLLGGDASRWRLLGHLPRLKTLDVLNYKVIAVGFPLLTVGIIFGAVWAATAWSRPWGFDPKETWSAITWLIYAIYLHVRYLAGWQGRRAAILSLIGFAAVLFTYLGVNYLLPGLHSYA